MSTLTYEQVAVELAEITSKEELIKRIQEFSGCRFKLDFTLESLQKKTIEQLKHILLAALFQEENRK